MLAIAALSFLLAADRQDTTNPAVRSSSRTIVAAINWGGVASPTFARLIDELGQQPVIVYVETTTRLRAGLTGATMHRLSRFGDLRYVWIGVDARWTHERLVGLIAHELQHALEIARDRNVLSADD